MNLVEVEIVYDYLGVFFTTFVFEGILIVRGGSAKIFSQTIWVIFLLIYLFCSVSFFFIIKGEIFMRSCDFET